MQTKNKELEKKLDESNDLLRLVLAKLEGEPPLKNPSFLTILPMIKYQKLLLKNNAKLSFLKLVYLIGIRK